MNSFQEIYIVNVVCACRVIVACDKFSDKFPREKSESTICIQEVLCPNCPSVCLPVHVRGCEMSHLLAWCPRYIQSVLTRY